MPDRDRPGELRNRNRPCLSVGYNNLYTRGWHSSAVAKELHEAQSRRKLGPIEPTTELLWGGPRRSPGLRIWERLGGYGLTRSLLPEASAARSRACADNGGVG